MKTLYESILDDEDALIQKVAKSMHWPYNVSTLVQAKRYDELKTYLLQDSEFKEDIISLFSRDIIIVPEEYSVNVYLNCDIFRPVVRFIYLKHRKTLRIDIGKLDGYPTSFLKYIKNKTKYSKLISDLVKKYNLRTVHADDSMSGYNSLYADNE
jgi:hypothetical protein